MKTVFLFLVLILFCSFTVDGSGIDYSDPGTIGIILAAVYELAARLVPTIKDYTIVGKVLKGLRWLSKFLNIKK